MRILVMIALLNFAGTVYANQAADNLAKLQNQQHIWASQRHQQAQRNEAYQQGIMRSQQRTNRVLQGQPPQIGHGNSQLRGW